MQFYWQVSYIQQNKLKFSGIFLIGNTFTGFFEMKQDFCKYLVWSELTDLPLSLNFAKDIELH